MSSALGSPTASTQRSTPRPSVAALAAALGSSSVRWTASAPMPLAIARRSATVSIAITWAAPQARATCTAQRPTGPRPSTATTSPGRCRRRPRGSRFPDVAGEQSRVVCSSPRAPCAAPGWPAGRRPTRPGPLQRAERGPVPERARVHAALKEGPPAEEAAPRRRPGSSRGRGRRRRPRDGGAGRDDGADVLVADREPARSGRGRGRCAGPSRRHPEASIRTIASPASSSSGSGRPRRRPRRGPGR